MSLPRVIAKQGHDAVFLIETREDDGRRYGCIYDTTRDEVFPEMLVASIAARGYWDDFTGSDKEREAIEAEVRERLEAVVISDALCLLRLGRRGESDRAPPAGAWR